MNVSDLTHDFRVGLPTWIDDELAPMPHTLPDRQDRMRLVLRLAARNYREKSGGPFAAMVAEQQTGRIVSVGVNLVLASNLSVMHAEVVALSLAQARLATWDLGAAADQDHELLVNWRPCAQCYGAVLWSGVTGLAMAGEGRELEQLTGFDEGPMRDDWAEQLRGRGVGVVTDVLRDEAVAVFQGYRRAVVRGEVSVYNARGTAGRDN